MSAGTNEETTITDNYSKPLERQAYKVIKTRLYSQTGFKYQLYNLSQYVTLVAMLLNLQVLSVLMCKVG
jgi:hypothetical protein